jgi:hypothetical protein
VFAGLLDETAPRILVRAANGIGKTTHLAWFAAKRMLDTPGLRVRAVGPTHDHVHKVLGGMVADFVDGSLAPGNYYVQGRGWNGGRARETILTNGSRIEWKAQKDDPESHSGSNRDLIVWDEPAKQAHYTENAARIRESSGQLIMAATMVNMSPARRNWLRGLVQGEDIDPETLWTEDQSFGRSVQSTGWVQYVAEYSLENAPWYTAADRADWLGMMSASPWQYDQRVRAGWEGGMADDRLLRGFSDANVSRSDPPGKVKIGIAMDHGEIAGHQVAVLFGYSGSRIWVLDEYVSEIATGPEEDARSVIIMLRKHGISVETGVDLAVGDVNTVGKSAAGWKVNEAIEDAIRLQCGRMTPAFKIKPVYKGPGAKEWGLRCINYASRRGDLSVHPRCHKILESLRHWKGTTNGEDGKLSHAADALRYALITVLARAPAYARLRLEY